MQAGSVPENPWFWPGISIYTISGIGPVLENEHLHLTKPYKKKRTELLQPSSQSRLIKILEWVFHLVDYIIGDLAPRVFEVIRLNFGKSLQAHQH